MVEKKQKFAKIIGKGQIENGRRGLKFLMFGLKRPRFSEKDRFCSGSTRSSTGHIENRSYRKRPLLTFLFFDNCTIFELEILQIFKYKLKSV